MLRNALRRGWDELGKWAEERHVEREVDLDLGLFAAEAALEETFAQVFAVTVSQSEWETQLTAVSFPDGHWQQTLRVTCRQRNATQTTVALEVNVSQDREEGFHLIPDPPASRMDPATAELEAIANEVLGRTANGERGPLRKRFELAEVELQLPLARQEAVEALRGQLEKQPAYEGDVGVTSFARLEDVHIGAGSLSLLRGSIHQDAGQRGVAVHLDCHLRDPAERPEVEKGFDRAVALLKTAAPSA
jgi:hypothetical protein